MVKVGILGYGNLGRGAELGIKQNSDMELVAVFTRRNPESVKTYTNVQVVSVADVEQWKDKIDVMILCGGSATDLPEQGPRYAEMFNIIDSFDTHAKVPEYFAKVNEKAKKGNKISIISVGWDPGLFSLNRLYAETILPEGNTYTFWGKGVSQGHSDAIRRIDGVKDARQYTIPVSESLEKVRKCLNPNLTTREKHIRECFVVAYDDADKEKIKHEIITMPNYFDEYDTIVHFIDEEEMRKNHSNMPHGGFVIRTGKTNNNNQIIEYNLKLDSNPEFTASILVAYARACYRLNQEKQYGCKTVLDIPPIYLSLKNSEDVKKTFL